MRARAAFFLVGALCTTVAVSAAAVAFTSTAKKDPCARLDSAEIGAALGGTTDAGASTLKDQCTWITEVTESITGSTTTYQIRTVVTLGKLGDLSRKEFLREAKGSDGVKLKGIKPAAGYYQLSEQTIPGPLGEPEALHDGTARIVKGNRTIQIEILSARDAVVVSSALRTFAASAT
jgi:hypothetical protein